MIAKQRYRSYRISRSFRFSSIWIRNTYVPRSTYCRVRAPSADGQNRAAVWHLSHTGSRECGAVHERVTIHNRPVRVQFVDRKWVRFSCHQVHTSLINLCILNTISLDNVFDSVFWSTSKVNLLNCIFQIHFNGLMNYFPRTQIFVAYECISYSFGFQYVLNVF